MPKGMKFKDFGELVGWGRGNFEATGRINSVDAATLRARGVTPQMAREWQLYYRATSEANPLPMGPSKGEHLVMTARSDGKC